MTNNFGAVKNTSINLPLDGYIKLTSLAAPSLSDAGTGVFYFDTSANKFRVSENGGSYANITGQFTPGGDLTGTSTSQTVSAISGSTPIVITPATLQWATGTSSPSIKQADNTTNSATATNLTIQAQNATGTTAVGGNLVLTSGTGTSTNGNINLQAGGSTQLSITTNGLSGSSAPIAFSSTSVSTTGGTTTLSSGQYQNPLILLSGTLSTNATIVFPNTAGFWIVSTSGLTLGGNTLTFQSGSTTSTAISSLTSTSQLFMIITRGSNTIDINQ